MSGEFFFDFEHPRAGRVRMPGIPWLFGEERPVGSTDAVVGEAHAGGSVW